MENDDLRTLASLLKLRRSESKVLAIDGSAAPPALIQKPQLGIRNDPADRSPQVSRNKRRAQAPAKIFLANAGRTSLMSAPMKPAQPNSAALGQTHVWPNACSQHPKPRVSGE